VLVHRVQDDREMGSGGEGGRVPVAEEPQRGSEGVVDDGVGPLVLAQRVQGEGEFTGPGQDGRVVATEEVDRDRGTGLVPIRSPAQRGHQAGGLAQ